MKIRWDFVTNSSSTSFVIICKGQPSKSDFIAAMGLNANSPLAGLFGELFELLVMKMEPLSEARRGYFNSGKSIHELLRDEFSEQTASRVERALKDGYDVYMGRLSNDGEPVESFFCCESFEAEHGDFYLNALPCAW